MARGASIESGDLTDTAMHIMLALVRPRHGYAVMQFLAQQSDGDIVLGPASLYTTLKKLVAAAMIEEVPDDDSRRIYRLTSNGREALVQNLARRRRLLAMADQILEEA